MAKLELYLRGKKVIDQDVFLPEYDAAIPFEERCIMRTEYLDQLAADMFSDYVIPIMKVDYDYQIIFKTMASEDNDKI